MKYYINYHSSIDEVFIGPISIGAGCDEETIFTLADDMHHGFSSSCPVDGAKDLLESDCEWTGRGIQSEIRERLLTLISDSYLPMRNGAWHKDEPKTTKHKNRGDA